MFPNHWSSGDWPLVIPMDSGFYPSGVFWKYLFQNNVVGNFSEIHCLSIIISDIQIIISPPMEPHCLLLPLSSRGFHFLEPLLCPICLFTLQSSLIFGYQEPGVVNPVQKVTQPVLSVQCVDLRLVLGVNFSPVL